MCHSCRTGDQVPVVQKVDNAIHLINLYPLDNVVIYLALIVQTLDSAIHRINHYPADKYLGNQLRYPLDRFLSGG